MSYLENGATHRSMFRLMPPMHHDADPNRSQIIAHIMENTQWNVGRAVAAFNSMRNPRSRVLVFDKTHRVWKGCDWTPSHKDASEQMILGELRELQRRVIAMDSDLKKATSKIEKLERKSADRDDDQDQDEQENRPRNRRKQPTNTTESLIAQAWS
jgi:hypothetical protein